jgi:mycoredoxin
MYTTTWCGYCKRLKSQLGEAGIPFSEINIEEDPASAQFVEQVNGGNQTVPTLVYSDGSASTNPSIRTVLAKLESLAR